MGIIDYRCARCEACFSIDLGTSDDPLRLSERHDNCPYCGQGVGTGPVTCMACGHGFDLPLPHWHVGCDLASGNCPKCGLRHVSFCIC